MLKIKVLKVNFNSVNNISFIIIIVDLSVVSDHRSNDTINLFSAVANLFYGKHNIFFIIVQWRNLKEKKIINTG